MSGGFETHCIRDQACNYIRTILTTGLNLMLSNTNLSVTKKLTLLLLLALSGFNGIKPAMVHSADFNIPPKNSLLQLQQKAV